LRRLPLPDKKPSEDDGGRAWYRVEIGCSPSASNPLPAEKLYMNSCRPTLLVHHTLDHLIAQILQHSLAAPLASR